MTDSAINSQKQALRQEINAALAAAPAEALASAAQAVQQALFASSLYAAAESVFCYVSFGRELATQPILERVLADRKRLTVPLITGPGQMEARLVESLSALQPGSYGILEPAAATPVVAPAALSLLLVPGLAFDAAGMRLGRGAGFYDRFLSQARGQCIGLAYDLQLVEQVPCQAHDHPLTAVLSESGWHWPAAGR